MVIKGVLKSFRKNVGLVVILIAMLIELLVFNFESVRSLSYSKIDSFVTEIGSGLVKSNDGFLSIVDTENAYIQLSSINRHVDNIALNLTVRDWKPTSWRDALGPFVTISISAKDDAHADYFDLPEIEYCGLIGESHWNRIHLSGNSESIRIYFNEDVGFSVSIDDIKINAVRPLFINPIRVIIIAIIVLCLLLFTGRISSSHLFGSSPMRNRFLVCLIVALEILTAVFITRLVGISEEPYVANNTIYDFNQYNHLANALLSGNLSLNLPVSDSLMLMDNPYDPSLRDAVLSSANEYYYMDYAFYNGKYYSYFGVLPVLLLYIPFQLMTGVALSTNDAVTILSIVYIVAVNIMVISILSKSSMHCRISYFAVASLTLSTCSGFLYIAFLPQIYSVPIMLGLSVVYCGISIWLHSRRSDGSLSIVRLFLGGLLVAFSLACRPQYILSALFAIPIFWDEIIQSREFFSKKGILNTVAVIIPFILIAAPIMAYNYFRFDSPFDFGASYNLTGADMTNRGIEFARCPAAIFQYLFQSFNISARFPYFEAVNMSVDYQGSWFYEPFLGGFFPFAPVCYLLVLLPGWLKSHNGKLRVAILMLLIVASIILFLDFQIASITTRYFNDFGWMIILATCIMLCSEHRGLDSCPALKSIVFILVALGPLLNIAALFSTARYGALISSCPSLYYIIYWLI